MSLPTLVGVVFPYTLAWGLPHNGLEWAIIGLIALLLFGKRLPGVAKSIGQGIKEFKVGIKHAEAEAEDSAETNKLADESPKPRFDPHTGKPLNQA